MKNKGFKVTAIILALAVSIIAHPFSVVKAAMDHAEYNYSGSGSNNDLNYRYDRYIWSNDGTDVEPVTVAGNTLYCNEYTIFEIYFMQPTSGQLRVNRYTGANLSDFTFYINGGVFNGKQTAYMNVKFTNITHLTIIMTTYNNAAYADPTKVFTLGNFTLSEPTDTTDSTLNDIDILLENVDYTLQDILGYINGSNGILDYLDQIETYSEYLQNISLDLSNIDDTIDTITWNQETINFKGWTSNYSTFTPLPSNADLTKQGGYWVFENVSIDDSNIHSIFKFTLPLTGAYTVDELQFYTRTDRGWAVLKPETLIYRTNSGLIIYFILDDSVNGSSNFIYNGIFTVKFSNNSLYGTLKYQYPYSLYSIDQNDIEYWEIRTLFYQQRIQKAIESISSGISDNSAQNSISDITDDLNDQIAASNSATSSTEALLDNFNQNMNLTDYNFSISTGDHVTYFKQKLTDIYEIDEFKPFYLIPIILFVLGRILAG